MVFSPALPTLSFQFLLPLMIVGTIPRFKIQEDNSFIMVIFAINTSHLVLNFSLSTIITWLIQYANITEEELALFDILTKPEPKLEKKDHELVKSIAKKLLRTLKEERNLVLDWKKSQRTRAKVEVAIKDALYELPEIYSDDMPEKKCELVYKHVYEAYQGEGRSMY